LASIVGHEGADGTTLESGDHVNRVERAKVWLEESPGEPQGAAIDRMQRNPFEDDLGSSQTQGKVDVWVGGRFVPNCPRNLGHHQLTAGESSSADEGPDLSRLCLLDGELDQRRRV
jgi:hypothetical protein